MQFTSVGIQSNIMDDFDENDFEVWMEEVADEIFALLAGTMEEYSDVDYLYYYQHGYDPEAVVREIYES